MDTLVYLESKEWKNIWKCGERSVIFVMSSRKSGSFVALSSIWVQYWKQILFASGKI